MAIDARNCQNEIKLFDHNTSAITTYVFINTWSHVWYECDRFSLCYMNDERACNLLIQEII